VLRKTWRLFVALFGLAVAGAATLGIIVFVQYRRNDGPIVLPSPRGSQPVGRVLLDWKDARRNRELMVFLWYPAPDGASGRRSEYIPGKWGALEAEEMLPIPARRYREIQVSAIENAPFAQGVMPVLVLLPGMGRIPAHYTTIAEDLASRGYLVAGVTPTGFSRPVVFSDGRVAQGREDWDVNNRAEIQPAVDTWVSDASFALDQLARDPRFADHIRLGKAGIFGHSFGGNAALHALGRDARFARAADLDGGIFGNPVGSLDKPLLMLEGGPAVSRDSQSVCDSDRAGCIARAFSHARHMNFSDAGILPSRFPFPKSVLMLGDIDGEAFLRQVADLLRAFFDGMSTPALINQESA